MIAECIGLFNKYVMPVLKLVKINLGTFMALLINIIIYYFIVKFVGYENYDIIDKVFTFGLFFCTTGICHYLFNEWINKYNEKKENEAKKAKNKETIRAIYKLLQTCSDDELELLKRFLAGGSIQIDHAELLLLKNLLPRGFDEFIGHSKYMGVAKAFISPDFYYILKSYFERE